VGNANVLEGRLISRQDRGGGRALLVFEHPSGQAALECETGGDRGPRPGERIRLAIRGEYVDFRPRQPAAPDDRPPEPSAPELAAPGPSAPEPSAPELAASGSSTPGLAAPGLAAVITGKSFAGGQLRITARMEPAGPAGTAEAAAGTAAAVAEAAGGRIVPTEEISASRSGIDSPLSAGDAVWASWQPDRAVLVDREAEA
jgi:hypothetical protein